VRIEIWLELDSLTLPPDVQAEADKGRQVDALYQFELLASPRGKLWYLTRRIAEEDSVACVRYADWTARPAEPQPLFLSTVFLSNAARVNKDRASIAYSATLAHACPTTKWNESCGSTSTLKAATSTRLARDRDDAAAGGRRRLDRDVHVAGDEEGGTIVVNPAQLLDPNGVQLLVPFASQTGAPGVSGRLRFDIRGWNM